MNELMNERMNEQTNERTNERTDERTNERMNERMNEADTFLMATVEILTRLLTLTKNTVCLIDARAAMAAGDNEPLTRWLTTRQATVRPKALAPLHSDRQRCFLQKHSVNREKWLGCDAASLHHKPVVIFA